MNHQKFATILTIVLVIAWIASAIVRIKVEWPEMVILDGAMPIVISYWFAVNASKKPVAVNGNGNGGKHRADEQQ